MTVTKGEVQARTDGFRAKVPALRAMTTRPAPEIAPSLDHRAALMRIEARLARMEVALARIMERD